MGAGSLLIGFLNVCLTCAVIVLVAFVIVWVLRTLFGITIDGDVYKWGKIVIALLCLIVIFSWLFSLLGVGTAPHFFWRW